MYNTEISTDVNKAVVLLSNNELVAIPTETVYGLAGNACSAKAIRKIFEVKQRPATNPLIVHVDSIEKITPYITFIPATAKKLLENFSPGPLTVLLPGNGKLPQLVNSGRRDVAFRIPGHPLTLNLLKRLEFPLVAPSANIFTTISPTTPDHVMKNFAGKIQLILDGGNCSVGIESTVVGFDENETPVIYRQGAITAEQIVSVTGSVLEKTAGKEQLSPGMMLHHYSPKTPMLLVDKLEMNFPTGLDVSTIGVLCYTKNVKQVPKDQQVLLSVNSDLEEAAKNLYKSLHQLDEMGLTLIIAEKLPNIGLGKAINDRLQRAAYPFIKHNHHTNYPLCQEQSFAATVK
jgi:L-threonylcarbamoyladenylate synthase